MGYNKIVYVTGCLGFIGLHVTRLCLERGWQVIGIDKMTYASNHAWLEKFQQNNNFMFLQQDINDLQRLMDCDYVINTAAETHVDNSIASSKIFMHSNVDGVYHLLELIRAKDQDRRPIFLHFSTDEVYGDIESGSYVETDRLKPSNPYAASKAAADMLISAWARTYDIKYLILRPTNNYGIGQYVEKLIPKSIKHLRNGRKIDLHDRGEPIRNWLHVEDTARAVMTVIDSAVTNEIYNVCSNTELTNLQVIQKILRGLLGDQAAENWQDHMTFSQRPGQDIRYSLDDNKLKNLGWRTHADFERELAYMIDYYK